MNAESGLSVKTVNTGSLFCPVCGSFLEQKRTSAMVVVTCPEEHFQRQTHISDIESKLYVGLAGTEA